MSVCTVCVSAVWQRDQAILTVKMTAHYQGQTAPTGMDTHAYAHTHTHTVPLTYPNELQKRIEQTKPGVLY